MAPALRPPTAPTSTQRGRATQLTSTCGGHAGAHTWLRSAFHTLQWLRRHAAALHCTARSCWCCWSVSSRLPCLQGCLPPPAAICYLSSPVHAACDTAGAGDCCQPNPASWVVQTKPRLGHHLPKYPLPHPHTHHLITHAPPDHTRTT
jgi:hypothetical protein